MTGEGIGKRGRLALVFYLRIIIVCRRLSTTYGKAAVKRNLALGLGGEVQGVIHIELILKEQRERGNFIGQEKRESTFPTKKPPCAQQESQCAQRLKERIARKGGLRNLSPLPIQFEYFIVTSLAVRTFVVSVPSGITLTAKQGKAMQIHLIPHQDLLRDLFYFYPLVKCCLSLSLPRVSYTLLKSLQCK